jgi:hypothetical protein
LVLGIGVLVLSGCKINTDYFSEYRGKNLLGNYDFASVDTAAAPKWGLATSGNFMTWEKIGDPTNPASDLTRDTSAATPTLGPDGASPVYRLEVKNLIPNGDFEDASVTADGETYPFAVAKPYWSLTSYNGGTASTGTGTGFFWKYAQNPTANGFSGTINGRSLGWQGGAGGDQLRIDLSQAATAGGTVSSAWAVGSSYRFRCDFINLSTTESELPLYLYDSTGTAQVTAGTLVENNGVWTAQAKDSAGSRDNATVFSVSRYLTLLGVADPQYLAFGSNTAQHIYTVALDNVRMVPDDYENLWSEAKLPSLSSGTLPLLPGSKAGMYTFTVQVHDDPTIGTATTRSALNRFQPSGLAIRITAYTKGGLQTLYHFEARPSTGWTSWTTITFQNGFDFVNSDSSIPSTDQAMTISLSPTDVTTSGSADTGSLLVSQPTLTFNP